MATPDHQSGDAELAALLALDALEALEQADAELALGDFPAGLGQVSAALAEAVAAPPPADLRAEVLALARRRREPGRSAHPTRPCPPAEGFGRTVEDFRALLESLSDDEWRAPAHDDHGRVRDLVSHLIGVERLSKRWLSAPEDGAIVLDHLTASDDVVRELAGVDGPSLALLWHAAARDVAAAAAAGDSRRPVHYHELITDVPGHLTIRTFELWGHSMDISLATGRPLLELDDERMLTLSRRFMRVAPLALELSGRALAGRTVRFVLTGPAGGSYDVPLHIGEQPGEPSAVISADPVDVCRLAARRVDPAALRADIDGDRALAEHVLAGLSGLARD
jgi:uncharacterized protein (TIGR03083 family)